MTLLPLRLKYRNPNHAILTARAWEQGSGDRAGVTHTRVFRAGKLSGKTNNSGAKQRTKQGTGARRRSYPCGCGAV